MSYIVMKSWMAFTTTNLVMGVVIFAMFWHNAFSSCLASLMMKQGFQLCMYDNVFAFKGFNHLNKSSIVHWLVIIHVKGTPMWCTSKPIKMNKWNFMSLVPNVASIEITPLWPHENIDWHWISVWMPMVNGTWT